MVALAVFNRLEIDTHTFRDHFNPGCTIGQRGAFFEQYSKCPYYSVSPDTREAQRSRWLAGLIIRAAVAVCFNSAQSARQIAGAPGPAVRAC